MKILTIHADYVEFKAKKKALKDVEDVPQEKQRIDECLVVLTAFEKSDEINTTKTTERYVKEIVDIAKQVQTKNIVLYPYAHLSSHLGNPKKAAQLLIDAEKLLKDEYNVSRAPFGWYKSFNIACKGHPLSELSREFTVDNTEDDEISEALKAEDTLISKWFILDTKGKLNPIEFDKKTKKFSGFNFSNWPGLLKFSSYELAKNRVANQEPPHVVLMKKLELVDYEPGSDPGNLRYYPKGRLIKGLLEKFVTQKVKEYGGMEIEAPIMYDYEHPSLKSYMHRFPARQYTIQTPNKKCFLRFAACFGQFLEMHDAQISYKQMPVWLYEMTRYSFRVEQHGELTGLRRLRAFTMPDTHAFCTNVEQAKKEMKKRCKMSKEVQEGIGFKFPDDFEFAIRITEEFWEKHQEFIKEIVKDWEKPTLIEMWDKRFFYFSMKYEWNIVDALDKCSTLTTDQIDVENAQRYDITYVDENSKKQYPLILHCSPSGAIERVMYALLEKEAIKQKVGKTAMLPLWLSPTQIRIIPVSIENHLEFCEKLAKEFSKHNIRVDIDDREESVGKRIRTSQQEWVPYTIVIGDEEIKDNTQELKIKDRELNEDVSIHFNDLVEKIKQKTKGLPFDTLPMPRNLSKRISFN